MNDLPPIEEIEVPDLSYFVLMLEPDAVVNGYQQKVDVAAAITTYQRDLTDLVEMLKRGETPPKGFKFFVPDLWHVAMGRAKSFAPGEGEELFGAQVLGIRLGEKYLQRPRTMEMEDMARFNYPGAIFVARD